MEMLYYTLYNFFKPLIYVLLYPIHLWGTTWILVSDVFTVLCLALIAALVGHLSWTHPISRPRVLFVSYAEADRLLHEQPGEWVIAPREDTNGMIGMVYIERRPVMGSRLWTQYPRKFWIPFLLILGILLLILFVLLPQGG